MSPVVGTKRDAVAHIDFHSKVDASNVLLRSVGGLVDRMQIDAVSQMSDRELWAEFLGYLRAIPGISVAAVDEIEAHLNLSENRATNARNSIASSPAQMPVPFRVRDMTK